MCELTLQIILLCHCSLSLDVCNIGLQCNFQLFNTTVLQGSVATRVNDGRIFGVRSKRPRTTRAAVQYGRGPKRPRTETAADHKGRGPIRPRTNKAARQNGRMVGSFNLAVVGHLYTSLCHCCVLYILCHVITAGHKLSWWSGVVVSALALINGVNQRRARLVLRWATVSGFSSRCRTFILVCYVTNQPPKANSAVARCYG